MDLTRFLLILGEVDQRWKELRNAFPQYKDYLKKCDLAITYRGSHYDLKKEIDAYGMQHYLPLIQPSASKDGLAYLFDHQAKALEEKTKIKDPKQEALLEKEIQSLRADIGYFPLECLDLVDDFNVEIVFPTLLREAIETLKAHHLVNAEKTCQCAACIRVYLY